MIILYGRRNSFLLKKNLSNYVSQVYFTSVTEQYSSYKIIVEWIGQGNKKITYSKCKL